MDTTRFDRLVDVMNRIAAGDRAAVVTLYMEYGRDVARPLRAELRRLGQERVDRGDLDGLVFDACDAIGMCAGAWQPHGGALPWTWARSRIANVASRFVGQYADSLDDERHDVATPDAPPTGGGHVDDIALLEFLARRSTPARLLLEALEVVASPRDRAITLEMRGQAAEGDPSPANTVARRHRMTPEGVRQVACRVRRRLHRLAAADSRYAFIADLPLVT